MSVLYNRLRVRRVMLQPEIEKEPVPKKRNNVLFVCVVVAGIILSKLKT